MRTHDPTARPASARHQAGLTLIEMMVTVLIALFLIGGLLVMLQHTRAAYTSTNQLSTLQDNERLAISMITDVVQSAGYFPDPVNNTADLAFPAAVAPFVLKDQVVTGTQTAGLPDTLAVRFQTTSGDQILNCIGQSNTKLPVGLASNTVYINAFSIVANQLQCDLNDGATDTVLPLVEGVQDMQVWFGVKRDFTQDNYNVDTYVRPVDMVGTDWNNVSAVKVVLTFANPLQGLGQPATITFERVIAVMNRAGVKT